jgi:uncharacterized membrane protein YhaH (DUF805 family)
MIAFIVYAFVVAWISLATSIKRLHDVDLRAWWMLVFMFIPIFGLIAFLIVVISRSYAGPNRFGPNPLPQPPATESAVAV